MRYMKDYDMRSFVIKDINDVKRFFEVIEKGMPRCLQVMRQTHQSNLALKSINASFEQELMKLKSAKAISEQLSGENDNVSSVSDGSHIEEVNDVPKYDITAEEARRLMNESDEYISDEDKDDAELINVEIKEEDDELQEQEEDIKEDEEVLDEESLNEEPLDEEPLNEEPTGNIAFEWPVLSAEELEKMYVSAKEDGMEKRLSKDGVWMGLRYDGYGVIFSNVSGTMSYYDPSNKLMKADDAPEKFKELVWKHRILLVELTFRRSGTPGKFSFKKVDRFLDEDYLKEVFARQED